MLLLSCLALNVLPEQVTAFRPWNAEARARVVASYGDGRLLAMIDAADKDLTAAPVRGAAAACVRARLHELATVIAIVNDGIATADTMIAALAHLSPAAACADVAESTLPSADRDLSRVLGWMGAFPSAEELDARALARLEQDLGATNPAMWRAHEAMAIERRAAGDLPGAAREYRLAADLIDAVEFPREADAARIRRDLVWVLGELGRYHDAQQLIARTRALHAKNNEHEAIVWLDAEAAELAIARGLFRDALRIVQASAAHATRGHGSDIASLHALLLILNGKLGEATAAVAALEPQSDVAHGRVALTRALIARASTDLVQEARFLGQARAAYQRDRSTHSAERSLLRWRAPRIEHAKPRRPRFA